MFPSLKYKLLFLIVLASFIGVLVVVILNFNGVTLQDQVEESTFWLRVSLVSLLIIFILAFLRWLKLRKMEKSHYQESLKEGGVEEARIFRNLTEIERAYLVEISKARNKNDYYLDSRSPVFRVQGNVFKQIIPTSKRGRRHLLLRVRNQGFTEKSSPDLEKFFDSIKEGDEIAVEYSPRTKHVWKIYKTQDLK